MYERRDASVSHRLLGETRLAEGRAAVLKQTYTLLGLAVFAAMVGGYVGATSELAVRLFSTFIGWIVAMVLLNVVPRIALAARGNPTLGVAALVVDGFLSGLVLAPILYVASVVSPDIVPAALMVTGAVFGAVTLYVFTTRARFSAPRGLMAGAFVAIVAAIVLNSFLHIGIIGIFISAAIGIVGVLTLVYATSGILHDPAADSPIPGALMLFAGLFNVFVAALNILLRLSSRD
jgi:modulator of FtsH protease